MNAANVAHAAAEVVSKGAPPVSVGFTWAAAGTWSLVAVIGGFITALVKAVGIPRLVELMLNRDEAMRGEKRAEETTNAARITALESRMERTGGALVFCIGALTTAIDGLESEDRRTRDIAASRARESIALAASTLGNEDPYSKALARLASVPPVSGKAI